MNIDEPRVKFEAECEAIGDFSKDDVDELKLLMNSTLGKKLYCFAMRTQAATQRIPATQDLSTDVGVKNAIKAQGVAQGWAQLLDCLWDFSQGDLEDE